MKIPFQINTLTTLLGVGIWMLLSLTACNSTSGQYTLEPKDFQQKMKEANTYALLDVRTAGEFAQGALENARNVDWNDGQFEQVVTSLDRKLPVFVYCLAGSRSASAAQKMRTMGFANVYELKGGILSWKQAGLKLAGASHAGSGYTPDQYAKITSSGAVLVDFYADWCGPCKRLAPILDKLGKEYGDKVKIVRVDADQSQDLAGSLQVTALPTLFFYRNGKQTWKTVGLTDEATLRNVIEGR
jgi:thioredoxin 1